MPWTQTEEPKNSNVLIFKQTLTTKEGGNGTEGDNWTSEVDFIPPGHDFHVIANTGGTNLSTSSHVELFYATATGAVIASRTRINETPFISLTAEIDNVTLDAYKDMRGKAWYPYYYLKIPTGGGSVIMTIIIDMMFKK